MASTPAEAAEVNTNFTNLVTFLNNSVVHRDGSKAMTANFDAGANKIINLTDGTSATDAATKGQVDAAVATIDLGAWTSYTPTFTQSATISKTINYAKYARIGRTIHCVIDLTATSSGTGSGNHNIVVSVPVAAASASALAAVGSYATSAGADSFSTIAFAGASTTTITADFGSTAAFLAGYRLRISFTYEAAS